MKRILKLNIILSLFLYPLSSFADYAVITKLRGKVTLTESDGQGKRNLSEQDKVFSGQIIYTEAKSIVKIKFEDNSTIVIGQRSQLVLNKIISSETKVLGLINGYIRGKFNKSKMGFIKAKIKTESAALGIRGTDFNIIYNKENQITTAISFSGDVEFSSINGKRSKEENKPVHLTSGNFSSTFKKSQYVSPPIKMSPEQFEILRNNQELTSKKKHASSKKDRVNKISSLKDNKSYQQDIPRELVGDGYGQIKENFLKKEKLYRPGGYIDLNTGIYIEPPSDAIYDKDEMVFKVPKELGGFDSKTGEYIPPLGLILHPLKGFVLVSSAIESGIKYIRKKVTGLTEVVGSKLNDVKDAIYQSSETDNSTSVIDDAVEGAKDAGYSTLGSLADNLNNYLYQGVLQKLEAPLKSLPLISSLDLRISDTLSYSTVQKLLVYKHVEEIVKTPSFTNDLHLTAAYKKTLWNKLFIRPRINFYKRNHIKDKVTEIKALDNYHHRTGLDIGVIGKLGKYHVQTYFFFDYFSQNKFNDSTKSYTTLLRDKRYGFSKLIVGTKYLSSRFDYYYTNYRSAPLGNGDMHTFLFSEILNLNNKNFLNFTLNWAKRKRELSNKDILIYGTKLEYYLTSMQHGFNVKSWLEYNTARDQLFLNSRGKEVNIDLGLKLVKKHSKLFSTSFTYLLKDIKSKSLVFDSRAHNTSLTFNLLY
ncbi:hypothetical protein A9Q84_18190 [Halobacteriovorax marinus]|uniref:FecR protein domain-containing protein n=1 Tax=Halobacteriovorax marinus TaxID=97084 RepID=A0A1Y5F3T4_9BACT|nr:hypothetical protein A9Q84_18190 [Halobacteriovorax marinus]